MMLALAAVLLLTSHPVEGPKLAQDTDAALVNNPDLLLPRERVRANVQYSLREARNREEEAVRLQRQDKRDEALERWRDAMARYETLRREHLSPDLPRNAELLVRVEWIGAAHLYSETWQPLADYINARYRRPDWPRPLREQLGLRQAAQGNEMLRRAVDSGDEALLRRCARFYQFSDAGRAALRMMAELSLERGDALAAVRWLEELQGSWPEYYERDSALQVLYVRACRESGNRYRLGAERRRRERMGVSGKLDVGGVQRDSESVIREIAEGVAPSERPELRPTGWRTLQGVNSRNGVAPPVVAIGEMVDLDSSEGVQGRRIAMNVPGLSDQHEASRRGGQRPVPFPVPVTHEAGWFMHRIDETGGNDEKLLWFRHGRESSPVTLEVPSTLRYPSRQETHAGFYFSGQQQEQRMIYRVMGSSIGTLRWELDHRESDVLFAVMGPGQPARERGVDGTGNVIQAWDLTDDAKLRVTLPNRRVESDEEYSFLRHVIFTGAPLVQGNRLYIAGCVVETDSVEIWLFCFDVTPKGDAAQGEGKLQWRVQLCSHRQQSQPWRYTPVILPQVSSPSDQGGMLYVSTHAGATAAVDRETGELCWISQYARMSVGLRGWFPGPAVAADGHVVTTPYDYDLALVLDAVWGTNQFGYPLFRKGPIGEFEYLLGVVDNRMIIQGRSRIFSVALTDFRPGGVLHADGGTLSYQSTEFGREAIGRGVIAGDQVLIPFDSEIAFYDVHTGKLLTRSPLSGVTADSTPFALTVYCRGEAYEDEHGVTRYRPVTVTDPDSGNVYNVEHLRNGEAFKFGSGKSATVVKETFVILSSARWTYLFRADDGGK